MPNSQPKLTENAERLNSSQDTLDSAGIEANGETCGYCGKPATGYAAIGQRRYCHDGEGASCYMKQMWKMSGEMRDAIAPGTLVGESLHKVTDQTLHNEQSCPGKHDELCLVGATGDCTCSTFGKTEHGSESPTQREVCTHYGTCTHPECPGAVRAICMCDGGGSVTHAPGPGCTSGPYQEYLRRVDDHANNRIAEPPLTTPQGDNSTRPRDISTESTRELRLADSEEAWIGSLSPQMGRDLRHHLESLHEEIRKMEDVVQQAERYWCSWEFQDAPIRHDDLFDAVRRARGR
jgi:hypothetical protein